MPLTHHAATKPGPHVVSHQGTTTANECAAYAVAADQQTVLPCGGKATPWVSPRADLQTLGVQLGYSMNLEFREGLVPAKHELQAAYSAPITSHNAPNRLKTRSPGSYVCLKRGFFSSVCGTDFKHQQVFYKKS